MMTRAALLGRCLLRREATRAAFRPLSSSSSSSTALPKEEEEETCSSSSSEVPVDRIRNFSIVAHIDHGKSTLADFILYHTGALSRLDKRNAQVLDKLQVEKERGITVKAQTASIVHTHSKSGLRYLLNLVDTPGHVDFSYEVSRSLAACEGCVLLVDATQGIQAQTVSNCLLALEQNLDILPVVNKIDMPNADPEDVAKQMDDVFGLGDAETLRVSAKTGQGVPELLDAIADKIRPPSAMGSAPLRALIFDAHHDQFRGVIVLVRVVDGSVAAGDKLTCCGTGRDLEALEVGLVGLSEPRPTKELLGGQIGYVVTGMKDNSNQSIRIGDTLRKWSEPDTPPLEGFAPTKSMCFGGIFPSSADEYPQLKKAVEKLVLNDSSVVVHREASQALGPGFRCGFLGLLHMEVFLQRLEAEFGQQVISTKPFVPLKVIEESGEEREILSPSDFDTIQPKTTVLEPTVLSTIICPNEYVGKVMQLCQEHRGQQMDHATMGSQRTMLRHTLPLPELAGDFYDNLKSLTSGYATFEYEESGHQPVDLVKLDIRVNGEAVDSLSQVVPRESAYRTGKSVVARMKGLLDRQVFEVALQAVIGNKIVARESIVAMRKNVLAKCYGGDVSRKKKLLQKQKEGKKRLKKLGSVSVPVEVFPALLRK